MPPKGWKKDKDGALTKQKDAALIAPKTVTKTVVEEIKTESKPEPIKEVEAKPMGSVNKETKQRLPKITISTYNKEGNLITKQYTCTTVRISEDTETVLSGSQPTQRKDVVHISIDADVVDIM